MEFKYKIIGYLFLLGGVLFALTSQFGFNSERIMPSNDLEQKGNINLSSSYDSTIIGPVSQNGNIAFDETVTQIMERERRFPSVYRKGFDETEKEKWPDRSNLLHAPGSRDESTYPYGNDKKVNTFNQTDNPQTVSTNFTATRVDSTNALPADNMGAVGPTQYIVAVNGRIKSFNKTTGALDGVINASTNSFFNSVRNGSGTSDPRIRYDRMSKRWFIIIINVSTPNRILFAKTNDTTITGSTVWSFFFTTAPAGCLADYPTLGIDNNALYIGTNNFCPSFTSTYGYVINKANLIAGTLTVTVFSNMGTTSSDGPYTPQGVDNFDASATEGYFIGVSIFNWNMLIIRRVSNPGGVPTLSGNINLTTPNTTSNPLSVDHLGRTGTSLLDALDDRLFAACIRNGRLWTAHNIGVNNSGGTSSPTRTGSRWYEIQNLTGTPTFVQSGTIFDNAVSNGISYWIPSVMVSGQGHAAFIFSSAGVNARINQSTNGRLSGDILGTTQTVTNVTSSSFAYNIQAGEQRWGDYSYVSLDPNDDMTMWGVMSFCDATNSYGVRVAKLLAPPPATPTSATPNSINPGQPSVNVVISGTQFNGSGFYDPGAGFSNRISATVTGGVTVNSVTYTSPTSVTLNISTMGATTGSKDVTIINPDGQSITTAGLLDVPLPVSLSSFTSEVKKRDVVLKWTTTEEINNRGFEIYRQSFKPNGELNEWVVIGFVNGNGTSNNVHNYIFSDNKLETGKYNYKLKQIDFNGGYENFNLQGQVIVGVPAVLDVSQNYPNPFNPVTKIDYGLPTDGKISIKVYDITGREVAVLSEGLKTAGYYTVEFNSEDLSSGVYFYRMVTDSKTIVKKMLVIK